VREYLNPLDDESQALVQRFCREFREQVLSG
jgi:hypothetical protein